MKKPSKSKTKQDPSEQIFPTNLSTKYNYEFKPGSVRSVEMVVENIHNFDYFLVQVQITHYNNPPGRLT